MDYPVSKEPKIRIEYTLQQDNAEAIKMNPVVIENDNSLCGEIKSNDVGSRRYLNESVTFPSRNMLFAQNFNEIKNVYADLNFNNTEILHTAFNILQLCIVKNITDIRISKTGDNELLLYRKNNGSFSNILIDEDGDVSYMYIGNLPGQERTSYFPHEEGFNYSQIVSLL